MVLLHGRLLEENSLKQRKKNIRYSHALYSNTYVRWHR